MGISTPHLTDPLEDAPEAEDTQVALETLAQQFEPKLTIDKENGKATITIGDKWFQVYRMRNGGIRYQAGTGTDVENLDFTDLDDLAKKLSAPFTSAFGSGRPNLRKQVNKIYKDLELVPTGSVPVIEEVEVVETNEDFSYSIEDDKNAILNLDGHAITIQKMEKGIQYSIDGRAMNTLYFNNLKDLNIKMGSWLDHELGTNRSHAPVTMRAIYTKLKLTEVTGREERVAREEAIQKAAEGTILDLDYGSYDLGDSDLPETYLLVRNKNHGKFYCLSLVQETFDMIFGKDEGERAGLWSSPTSAAEGLQVYDSVPMRNEKYNDSSHVNLKKGTVLRLSNMGGMTHVGISLGNDKIAHIIRNTLYIDKLSDISEGWNPREILTPDASFVEKPLETKTHSETFMKGRSLEAISPYLKTNGANLPKIMRYNEATIQEIVYQLNKDKFKLINHPGGARVVIKKNTKLELPKEWY